MPPSVPDSQASEGYEMRSRSFSASPAGQGTGPQVEEVSLRPRYNETR
jgi:hypothetical protein